MAWEINSIGLKCFAGKLVAKQEVNPGLDHFCLLHHNFDVFLKFVYLVKICIDPWKLGV